MTDNPPPERRLDDQEESVRIAVKALGDMRNSGARSENIRALPPISTTSSSYSSNSALKSQPLPSPSNSSQSDAASSSPAFVSRMSSFPLVGSALRVYEQGKASSRVVKYGAEMMESSVKTISRPVIDRLPVNVNQLDEFACRQLDRLDRYRRPSTSESPTSAGPRSRMAISPNPSSSGRHKLKTKTLDGTALEDEEENEEASMEDRRQWRGGERNVPSWLEANSPFVAPPPPPPDSRSSTPTPNGDDSRPDKSQAENSAATNQVAQRSRWQAVLLEAGGLSAALSEESMRRLKYCLQWLQYATAHIDAQILILRDFTANLQPSDSISTTRRPPISEEHMRKLTEVRRDIVHTIRQVVDVVSKYAGGALPEPARSRVRGFILKLPQRWATKAGPAPTGNVAGERETIAAAGSGIGALRRPGGQRRAAHRERGTGASEPGVKSGPNSRAPSPTSSPRISRAVLGNHNIRHGEPVDSNGEHTVPPSAALIASQRILTLATESLDMMRNVTGVVKDSLDRADAWVGRLRTVGIQRGAQEGEDTEDLEFEFSNRMGHRRRDSAQSDLDGMPSPFFSGSSTTWGSSIPSTPGGGAYTPGYGFAGNAPSPGAIPIGAMSLGSRYNTPKSVAAGLPEENEDLEEDNSAAVEEASVLLNKKLQQRTGGVAVVEADGGIEAAEQGLQQMDVDV